jgi:hypothetical protein
MEAMMEREQERPESDAAAGRCLAEGLAQLSDDGVERRHEALMEWAEGELQLEREFAEQVYTLAEEEDLEPIYAFHLIRCGVGVIELEVPEQDADDDSTQQTPPEWLSGETVELNDIALERRLRATFRRLRTHLREAPTTAAAVHAFLAEPDVAAIRLR